MKDLRPTIISNKKAGGDFRLMRLGSAYLAKTARPGQFVEVRCSAGPGSSDDPLLRRPLGVHRIVGGGVEILYEIVGRGTEILSRKKPGEALDVIGPLGTGFTARAGKDAVIVAGGIGAAPLVALAEHMAPGAKRTADKKRAMERRVFIGARSAGHALCEKRFKRAGFKVVISTEDGTRGRRGLVTAPLGEYLGAVGSAQDTVIYACGPTGMLKAVAAMAASRGIECQVSLEERMACGVGVCLGCPVRIVGGGYKMVCKDGPVFDATEIAWQ